MRVIQACKEQSTHGLDKSCHSEHVHCKIHGEVREVGFDSEVQLRSEDVLWKHHP